MKGRVFLCCTSTKQRIKQRVLLKDTTQSLRRGSKPRTLDFKSITLPLSYRIKYINETIHERFILRIIHPAGWQRRKRVVSPEDTFCLDKAFAGHLRNTQKSSHSGPLSARQRNAIQMAFRWWADRGQRMHTD